MFPASWQSLPFWIVPAAATLANLRRCRQEGSTIPFPTRPRPATAD